MTIDRSLLVPALVLGVLLAGCRNSDPITGVREPTPVPTDVNIAGAWVGTFNSFDGVDCDNNVPAHATFTQEGSTVDGTLDAAANGCGTSRVVIHAVFAGSRFEGTITSSASHYGFSAGSTVSGTLTGSGTVLSIRLRDAQQTDIPGGTMTLHR
jgi:hypothetical protein